MSHTRFVFAMLASLLAGVGCQSRRLPGPATGPEPDGRSAAGWPRAEDAGRPLCHEPRIALPPAPEAGAVVGEGVARAAVAPVEASALYGSGIGPDAGGDTWSALDQGADNDAGAGEGEAPGGQSLAQAASDPTAALLSLQVQNQFVDGYHLLNDATGDTLLFRAALPFKTGCLSHIARLSAPIDFDSPSQASGLGDSTLFDLIVFNKSWGRWGVGPVVQLPTASDDRLGSGQWAAGPAVGFTARSGKLLWGLFNQNLFSFAGDESRPNVNVSSLQPIVNYSLPCKWSVGSTEMNFLYDWDNERWAVLPLGVRVAKLVKFGSIPVQLSLGYEHNFVDDSVGPKDTFTFSLKFLLPMAGN